MENNRNQGQEGQSNSQGQQGGGIGNQGGQSANMGNQSGAGEDQQKAGAVRSDDMDTLNELEKKHGRGNNTRRGNSSIPEE